MKISNLPKASKASSSDLLTIVQGNKVKNISVKDLTKALVAGNLKLSSEIKALRTELSKNTINKNNPTLTKPLRIPPPVSSGDAANKGYIDSKVGHLIKVDGTSRIAAPLSYTSANTFTDRDLVDKRYADSLLSQTLKTLKHLSENRYPQANPGDTFLFVNNTKEFAKGGPEIQKGDILICISKSEGGTYGEVGSQFAIVNTNVVFGNETSAGILKMATGKEVMGLIEDSSSVSPKKIRDILEASSIYNRTLIAYNYLIQENDKGIIAIDSRGGDVTVTLPSISTLALPRLVKFVVKDEFGYAATNNITIKTSSTNTLEGGKSISINQKYQAISIYNDGKNYYIESNTHNSREGAVAGSGVLTATNKSYPSEVGINDPVYSFDVDLSQYDINEGFEIEYYGSFIDTTSNSADIMLNSVVIATTGTITAIGSFKLTATVLKSADLNGYIASYIGVDGVVVNNNFEAISLNSWLGPIAVQGTIQCATATSDALGHMFIVKPLK